MTFAEKDMWFNEEQLSELESHCPQAQVRLHAEGNACWKGGCRAASRVPKPTYQWQRRCTGCRASDMTS